MKKNLKAFLCLTALLGAMSTVNADDIIITQGDTETITTDTVVNGVITNSGTLENSAVLSAITDITNNIGASISNTGTITGGSLLNNGAISGGGNLTVSGGSSSGAISQNNINIDGSFANSASLTANGTLTNNSSLSNSSNIVAAAISNAAGSTIDGSGNIQISGGSNAGTIDQTNVTVGGSLGNTGTIVSTGTFTNTGTISGDSGSLSIKNGTSSGSITQGNITVSGNFTNSANLEAKTNLTNSGTISNGSNIIAAAIDNQAGGVISGAGNIQINGGSNAGTISQTDVTIGNTFENTGSLTSTGTFTNTGTITGDSGNLIIKDGSSTGSVTQNNISICGNFTNGASMEAKNKFTNTGSLSNSSSIIAAEIENKSSISNTGAVTADNNFTNSGTITGTGDLNIQNGGTSTGAIEQGNINITGNFTNKAKLEATDTLTNNGVISNTSSIVANAIDNKASGSISGTGNTTIGGGTNAGTISQKNVTTSGSLSNTGTITSTDTFTNTGTISGDSGVLNINKGSNSGSITQDSITISGLFTNNSRLEAKQKLTNKGNTINNNGTIVAVEIDNQAGKYITGNGNLEIGGGVNSGLISQKDVNVTGDLANNGTITSSGNFTNSADITGNNGTLNLAAGSNSGNITQKNVTVGGTFSNTGSFTTNNSFTNNGTLSGAGTITIEHGTGTNNGTLAQGVINVNNDSKFINALGKVVTVNDLHNAIQAEVENNGTFTVSQVLDNQGRITNKGEFNLGDTLTNDGIFINSGENAQMSASKVVNNNIFGVENGAVVSIDSINNTNGTIQINTGSTLNVTGQSSGVMDGIITSLGQGNTLDGGLVDITGTVRIGDGSTATSLTLPQGNITADASLNVLQNAVLNIGTADKEAHVIFNDNATDTWNGGVNLANGTLVLDNFNQNVQGTSFYEQSGGELSILNNSYLSAVSNKITGGDMIVDKTSTYQSQSNSGGFILDNLSIVADSTDRGVTPIGGLIGAMNGGVEKYQIGTMTIDNQANFTIDVLGRSNRADQHAIDQFDIGNLSGTGTINIADWGLAGDIFGWQAPIDRNVKLDNIFNSVLDGIEFQSTSKETFTPIGWYQLNNHGGATGTYSLDLVRFNPQVFRGQVTTISQYMNQLAIDDMLFNHSMLLPGFKMFDDTEQKSASMANKSAAISPLFAPYQYSIKDGGLWYKMYGTFEHLQMSQGLNVGNNAYGALIGADFGLKDLKNGWKFMPTAYIGYNGAHQYWAGMGAYQNGGQAGLMGTWYKDNFIVGGLIYGGIYDNYMSVAGRNDNTFNYFGGAATKAAYNWRLHRDWVLQPNLFLAYNYFGQQNWHSTFGQMGMMSGMLNGINLAPGVNLIWEKETFSTYLTLQYMYNLNGAVGGRAGNVYLPNISMERGYIQYGIGFTKQFTERFSGYLQAVLRNVGRTGAGFQMGFSWKL